MANEMNTASRVMEQASVDIQSAELETPSAASRWTDVTRRRGKRRTRKHYYSERKVRSLRAALAGTLVLAVVAIAISWVYASGVGSRYEHMVAERNAMEKALVQAQGRIEQLEAEKAELVQGRIPRLHALEYDQAIEIDKDYVRNVIFTLARDGQQNIYEYRIVLHNKSLSVVHPNVTVLLFDDVGVQVGSAAVRSVHATSDVERIALDPGEVRSYSSVVEMARTAEPSYFMIQVR